ncbi:MAG: protein adenylyltransferase SelO family protein, partial [Rhodoferax sp.]
LAQRMAAKLGFAQADAASERLGAGLLGLLHKWRVDYSIFWRRLSHWAQDPEAAAHPLTDLFAEPEAVVLWLQHYRQQIAEAPQRHSAALMLRSNPKYVLRNHLAESAIAAAQRKDYSVFEQLQQALADPFDEQPACDALADFPPAWASQIAISCSS